MTSQIDRPPLEQDVGEKTAGAAPSGGGFRAVVTTGDHVVWSCAHVHFTEHSAKACAERHLAAAAALGVR